MLNLENLLIDRVQVDLGLDRLDCRFLPLVKLVDLIVIAPYQYLVIMAIPAPFKTIWQDPVFALEQKFANKIIALQIDFYVDLWHDISEHFDKFNCIWKAYVKFTCKILHLRLVLQKRE